MESEIKKTKVMKTTTITIINGAVINMESNTFSTKAEYKNHINAMLAYVADKEKESNNFKSIYMDNCVAWKEAGVMTIFKMEA